MEPPDRVDRPPGAPDPFDSFRAFELGFIMLLALLFTWTIGILLLPASSEIVPTAWFHLEVQAVQFLLMALGALVYARTRGIDVGAAFRRGLPVRAALASLGAAALLLANELAFLFGLLALALSFFPESVRQWAGWMEHIHGLDYAAAGPVVLGAQLLIVVGLGPLVEEIVFRGLLFPRWSRKWSVARGIVGSSLVFGLLHFTRDPFGSTVFGMAMCLLYHHTRTLWAPFLAHAASNAVGWAAQLVLPRQRADAIDFSPTEIRMTLLGSALGLLVALPLLVFFFRRYWPRNDAAPVHAG